MGVVSPALIARLRASRLGELEVRTTDWRIRLRRDPKAAPRTSARSASGAGGDVPAELNGSVARSNAVGYFTPSKDLVGYGEAGRHIAGETDAEPPSSFHTRQDATDPPPTFQKSTPDNHVISGLIPL